MKRIALVVMFFLLIFSLSACEPPSETSSESFAAERLPPLDDTNSDSEITEDSQEPMMPEISEDQTIQDEVVENDDTEESEAITEDTENDLDESGSVDLVIPTSYADLKDEIETLKLPSQLIDIRFFSDSTRSVLPSIPNDGRTYPVGAFRAYYHDGSTIEIDIESPRMVIWYEQMYSYVYHIAYTLGQLPQSTRSSFTQVILIKDLPSSLDVTGSTIRVGQYYIDDAMRFGTLFYELFDPTSLASLIDDEEWSAVIQSDASEVSERSNENLDQDKLESIWALLYLQQRDDESASQALLSMANRKAYLELNYGFITADWLASYPKEPSLPPHDTMNISTNIIYPELITPEDPSTLESVDFVETGTRYYKRTRYYSEGTGTYPVHTFLATYNNGYTVNFHIDTAYSIAQAKTEAEKLAFMYGQVPGLLLAGMDDFILFKGEGHPSSGRVTMFFSNVIQNLGDAIEENLMHDMAHGSLDWNEPNGSRELYDIADNTTLIPHRGVLERDPWVQAAQEDNYFLSLYAKENPEREDVAETVIHYLLLRWRPERFNPTILNYIEQSISNRVSYLDQFDWQFPES